MAGIPFPIVRIFHLGAFCVYLVTIVYSFWYVDVPLIVPRYAYAGKAKFLTQWNLILCALYFGLCLVLNVLPLRSLYRVRDYVFCAVSLPSSIFVATVFWGLYAFDRELIFPKAMEPYYPNWVNHCSHTLVAITAICEAVLYTRSVPSRKAGYIGIFAWFSVYQIWILYLGLVHDVWVYQVTQVLSPLGRTAFFIGCSIIVYYLYLGCDRLLRLKNKEASSTAKRR